MKKAERGTSMENVTTVESVEVYNVVSKDKETVMLLSTFVEQPSMQEVCHKQTNNSKGEKNRKKKCHAHNW